MNQNQTRLSNYKIRFMEQFKRIVRPQLMVNRKQLLNGVFVLILLQLLDFTSTIIGLSYGLAKEANPMFTDASVYFFMVGKFLVIALLLMGYAFVNKTNKMEKTFATILTFAIPLYIVVVVNNLTVILKVF